MTNYLADYHLHSRQSVDAGDSMAAYVHFAAKYGVNEICFTDHVDFSPSLQWRDYFNWETYRSEFGRAVGNESGIVVRSGFEIDYQSAYEHGVVNFLDDKPVDFVIGSVHYVDDTLTMITSYFEAKGEDEAYSDHFDEVLAAAKSGLFDVLGHVDYPKRAGAQVAGPFPFDRFRGRLEEILRAAIETDTGIEVNAAGLTHAPGEPYPGFDTLKLYKSLGGRTITFGSDSHNADMVGRGIEKARGMAVEAGFTEFTVFENREKKFLPLD